MKRIITMILLSFAVLLPTYGQGRNSFEEYKRKKNSEFNKYSKKKQKNFEDYRRKRNEEFAEYLRKTWIGKKAKPKIDRPKDEPQPPVIFDQETPVPVTPSPIPFDEVVPSPKPEPQPQPIEPIKEVPVPKPTPSPEPKPEPKPTPKPEPVKPAIPTQKFSIYGTEGAVRFDKSKAFRLPDISENSVADAWLKLSGDDYTNIVVDCLNLRKELKLGDWAYLTMINKMAKSLMGKDTNEATLLTAFVYSQSGYKMRLANENGKLRMLYASKHQIFDRPYLTLDGDFFYCLGSNPQSLKVADTKYPNEKALSLVLSEQPKLQYAQGGKKTRKSKRYPEVVTDVTVNTNLLDFYTDYPTSMLGDNVVTKWAVYGNTPLSEDVKSQLYPSLKVAIRDCSKKEAVEKLLNYVQTGFEYEYDDKVWGHDRPFFAEESLHYPYCDCEDRAVLFSRLVRDLVGLDAILVFYPGHLASAVEFPGEVAGDYISYDGRKFTVCDPTYIGAPIGLTMPNMNNATAKVILLD
ncbi:MAG: hypothetical protein K2J58_04880 [Muribaculaceae bacterium]|nr:hypothetical protein [Muribaculaceae bacterium]